MNIKNLTKSTFLITFKILKKIIKYVFILPLLCLNSPDKYDIDKLQEHMDEFEK